VGQRRLKPTRKRRRSPLRILSHWQLGTLYLRLNRQEEGVQELLAVIANDPKGPYGDGARRILDELRKESRSLALVA
jgi:hypothetical protein